MISFTQGERHFIWKSMSFYLKNETNQKISEFEWLYFDSILTKLKEE